MRDLVFQRGGAFSLLAPNEQWDLHNFFVVTQEMADAELRLHRRLVAQIDPSLPQRAGRAYAKLQRGDQRPVTYAASRKERKILVQSVVKPQPDLNAYARILIRIAESKRISK